MEKDIHIKLHLNIILIIFGLAFWIIPLWLYFEHPPHPIFIFIIAPWLGLVLNAYLIMRIASKQFTMRTAYSIMVLISGASALKLFLAFHGISLYEEYIRAPGPPYIPYTPSIHLNFIFIAIAAIFELLFILVVLRIFSINLFHNKKFIVFTSLIISLGDGLWWLLSYHLFLIFNMGVIAG